MEERELNVSFSGLTFRIGPTSLFLFSSFVEKVPLPCPTPLSLEQNVTFNVSFL